MDANRTDDDIRAHREAMRERKRLQDEKVRSKKIRRGIVLVNTGDGKGKSTAAFGVALRAAGSGYRVGIVQFVKGKWKTGEKIALARFPEVDHIVSGEGFTWETQDRERDIAAAERGWAAARQMVADSRGDEPKYRVVIFDELNVVLQKGYLPVGEVVDLLRNKPPQLNIVVTGRGAPEALLEVADTVTEMKMVKHAFEAGIRAQRGIEF